MLTESELRNQPCFNYPWYHTLELLDGVWAPGCSFDNLVATRFLLDQVDVRGHNCLDIGAIKGLVIYLLERRGAAHVVAFDRRMSVRDAVSNAERFQLARRNLDSDAEYFCDVPLRDLQRETEKIGIGQFEVVVFSGVLYHMSDQLAALAQVRNLTRTGVVAIIETADILSPEAVMYANMGGRFYGNDDYGLISAGALEYWLRFFHFQPIDCCYLHHCERDRLAIVRICVRCRAVPTADDCSMQEQDDPVFARDFEEIFRPNSLPAGSEITPVAVKPPKHPSVWQEPRLGILDDYGSLKANNRPPKGNILRWFN